MKNYVRVISLFLVLILFSALGACGAGNKMPAEDAIPSLAETEMASTPIPTDELMDTENQNSESGEQDESAENERPAGSGMSFSVSDYQGPEIEVYSAQETTINSDFVQMELPKIEAYVAPELQDFYVEMADTLTVEEQEQMASMSEIEVADIVQKQYDLVADLYDAFAVARIDLQIDPVTGTIPIDSSLLYGTDEYEVTEEGKAVLRDIFGVYCSVLSQEKYRGFVSRIVIVGHTDTAGSYDYNLELSQKRAEAVRDFCLSDECGIENVEWLRMLLDAEGHSYDEPVYEADGNVNMDASRRVEIQFKIDLE